MLEHKHSTWCTKMCALVMLLGGVWMLHDAQTHREKSDAEIQQLKQTLEASEHAAHVLPQKRHAPQEVLHFYAEHINPIWLQRHNQPLPYSMEDWVADNNEALRRCKEGGMPYRFSMLSVENSGGEMRQAEQAALQNGWRNQQNKHLKNYTQAGMKDCMPYVDWYEAYVSAPDSVFQWQLLAWWLLMSYLKGMLMSALVFALRFLSNPAVSLTNEVRFAPVRALKMLMLWPKGLFIYPFETIPALELKRLRLEAEYLRGKECGYQLDEAERTHLRQLAQQQVTLRTLLDIVRHEQQCVRRRALATVLLCMAMTALSGSLTKAYAYCPQPHDVIGITAEGDEASRDGPDTPVQQCAELPALPEATALPLAQQIIPFQQIYLRGVSDPPDGVPKFRVSDAIVSAPETTTLKMKGNTNESVSYLCTALCHEFG